MLMPFMPRLYMNELSSLITTPSNTQSRIARGRLYQPELCTLYTGFFSLGLEQVPADYHFELVRSIYGCR